MARFGVGYGRIAIVEPHAGFTTAYDRKVAAMAPDIIDAVKILKDAYVNVSDSYMFGLCTEQEMVEARQTIGRAMLYLAKPDRFIRPKRGPSAVKTGKGKNPKRHIKQGVIA